MSIEKADWVVIRLLVDSMDLNASKCVRSIEYVRAMCYLIRKYGLIPVSDALKLIRQERRLEK